MSYVVIQQPLMNGGFEFRHTTLDTYYMLVEQNEGVRRVVNPDGEFTAYGTYILETLGTNNQMKLELAIARMEAANAESNMDPAALHLYNIVERVTDLENQLTKVLDQISALERKTLPLNVIGGPPRPLPAIKGMEERSLQGYVTTESDPDFAWADRELGYK